MKHSRNNDFHDDDQLGAYLRAHATRFDAGGELRASIRTQLTLKTAAELWPIDRVPNGHHGLAWRSATVGLIAGMVLTVALGLALRPTIEMWASRPSLESMLVSRHVVSMGQGPLFEVASSDRHTVKPWFQGKLDFAPAVPDLASVGFPLLGGRVDHIDGKTVAALAYAHNRHIVNVFVWPTVQTQAPQPSTRNGFHLSHWSDGEMQIWIVSDADASEIDRFGQAWRNTSYSTPATTP